MIKLLYIEASPRKERSFSSAAADAFLEGFLEKHPSAGVDHLDLWAETLPRFDGGLVLEGDAYRLDETSITTDQERASWEYFREVFERFASADAYLLSTPMWNFGVPYVLKQYFDIMAQPGLAFSYSSEGVATGHVTGRPITLIVARGGAYPKDGTMAHMDHQLPWLEVVLRFIGFESISTVVLEPTIGPRHKLADMREKAKSRARGLGQGVLGSAMSQP